MASAIVHRISGIKIITIFELVPCQNHSIWSDMQARVEPNSVFYSVEGGAVKRVFVIPVNILVASFLFHPLGQLTVQLNCSTIAKHIGVLAN